MDVNHAVWGAVIVGVVNILAVGISWGTMRQRLDDLEASSNTRLDRIEKAVGISNGTDGGAFVPRRECYLMEKTVQSELVEIKRRLSDIESTLHEMRGN